MEGGQPPFDYAQGRRLAAPTGMDVWPRVSGRHPFDRAQCGQWALRVENAGQAPNSAGSAMTPSV